MFFSISKTNNNDERFAIQHSVFDFKIHLDSGWEEINKNETTIFFKGYCDTEKLEEVVKEFINDKTPKYTGNFCIILADKHKVVITHDINRSFPLKYYANNLLTNLPYSENIGIEDHIWSDSFVEYKNSGINKTFLKNLYDIDVSKNISLEECSDSIKNILITKIDGLNQFVDTSGTINVFLSGGIDTSMVYSLLKKYYNKDKEINIITKEFFDFTKFTVMNMDTLLKHPNLWGYKSFHHWKEKTLYATGGMGDEIFMRGPTTTALWCAWNDINLIEEFEKLKYSYHKKYFLRDKNTKIINYYWNNRKELQKEYPKYSDLCRQICNMTSNDHQHWHLENTISWTPLKDTEILKTILKLPKEIILQQIIHGIVDIKIISELCPGLEKYICTHKNDNQYNNLVNYQPFLDKLNDA